MLFTWPLKFFKDTPVVGDDFEYNIVKDQNGDLQHEFTKSHPADPKKITELLERLNNLSFMKDDICELDKLIAS
jgi:hypothetical protein